MSEVVETVTRQQEVPLVKVALPVAEGALLPTQVLKTEDLLVCVGR